MKTMIRANPARTATRNPRPERFARRKRQPIMSVLRGIVRFAGLCGLQARLVAHATRAARMVHAGLHRTIMIVPENMPHASEG